MASSERNVTHVDLGLQSARDYWERVVLENVDAFIHEPAARTALNAAVSLWHVHEWVLCETLGAVPSREQKKADANRLAIVCPELAWLRDITDTSKHRTLTRDNVVVRQMQHIEDSAAIGVAAIGVSALSAGEWVLGLSIDDGSVYQLRRVIVAAVKHWRNHFDASQPATVA